MDIITTSKSLDKRSCGECVACCVYLKISELNKPGLTPCQHLKELTGEHTCSTEGGCSVYEDKPTVCRDYRCLWLNGHGAEEDRPDKSGLLMDTIHQVGNAIECKPIWEGADKQTAGLKAIYRMSQSTGKPVLVTTYRETRLSYVVGQGV